MLFLPAYATSQRVSTCKFAFDLGELFPLGILCNKRSCSSGSTRYQKGPFEGDRVHVVENSSADTSQEL